jgi:hypothetical protein
MRTELVAAVRKKGNEFWGTETTLEAMAREIPVGIIVLNHGLGKECQLLAYNPRKQPTYLLLYYLGANHYQPLYIYKPGHGQWHCALASGAFEEDRVILARLNPASGTLDDVLAASLTHQGGKRRRAGGL